MPRRRAIAAPALLLSGALDPVTPPHRAEDAARFMAHAQLLAAPNAGHGVSQLGCAPRLLRAFLDRPRQQARRRLPERDPGPDLPARQRRAATLNATPPP